jgi:hypothetical protein
MTLLDSEDLVMEFPEQTLHGRREFVDWYERVTRTFFDERHELKQLKVNPGDERADVVLIVNWQARRWTPPAPRSDWLGFDATQRWKLRRDRQTQRLVVFDYVVQSLDPMPGSTPL